jgi:hypothetical protein
LAPDLQSYLKPGLGKYLLTCWLLAAYICSFPLVGWTVSRSLLSVFYRPVCFMNALSWEDKQEYLLTRQVTVITQIMKSDISFTLPYSLLWSIWRLTQRHGYQEAGDHWRLWSCRLCATVVSWHNFFFICLH